MAKATSCTFLTLLALLLAALSFGVVVCTAVTPMAAIIG